MFVGNFENNPVYVSDKPNKKYYIVVNNKKLYFGGDPRFYQHYRDKFGYYDELNHYDDKRRVNFWKRHAKNVNDVNSAAYYSARILW